MDIKIKTHLPPLILQPEHSASLQHPVAILLLQSRCLLLLLCSWCAFAASQIQNFGVFPSWAEPNAMRAVNRILHFGALGLAVLVGLYLNTFSNTPHVSLDTISKDGGFAFIQADGRITEYFLYGDHSGVPLVFFHGASLSGSVASSWDTISKKNKVFDKFVHGGMGRIVATTREKLCRRGARCSCHSVAFGAEQHIV